jgi:TPR repeat protein
VILLILLALTAASGSPRAQEATGWDAYAAKDYDTAEALWLADAKRGDAHAAFGLSILADRKGDQEGAARWLEKAASAGHAASRVLLGQRYAEGNGVAKDPVRAYAWYTRAIAARVPNAGKLRDQLAATMTPEEIASAEALAATLGAQK